MPVRPSRLVLALLVAGGAATAACSAGDAGPTCSGETSAALRVCAAGATVAGVDVSTYQSTVDWAAVKKAGKVFAIARVSDGLTHVDDQFAANWPGMKAAGLVRGVYQFFRPGEDPTQQADLVVTKLAAAGGFESDDLPVVMDIEVTDNQSPATIQAHMQTWLDRIQAKTGKKPMIYTAAFMSSSVGNGFASYPLWVANYGVTCPTMPSNFTQWKFWQNSSTGSVSGISGDVDLDEFNGTLADLIKFTGGGAPPPSTDAGAPMDGGSTSQDAGGGDAARPDAGMTMGGANDAAPPPPAPTSPAPGAAPCL